MTDQKKEQKFAENVGLLLIWLKVSGYEFTLVTLRDSLSMIIDLGQGRYDPPGKYWEALGMKWNGFRTFSYGEKKNAS